MPQGTPLPANQSEGIQLGVQNMPLVAYAIFYECDLWLGAKIMPLVS